MNLRIMMNQYITDNVISKNIDRVGLLFSCGIDSVSILFSLLECGIKPTIYTFRCDKYLSEDFLKSKHLSERLNLKFIEVVVPTSVSEIEQDVRKIIKEFKVKKKTQVQCIHPFLYIDAKQEDIFISGLCADDLYGTSRKMSMLSKSSTEFYKARRVKQEDLESSSYLYIKNLFKLRGVDLLCPYKECHAIVEYLLSMSYDELNKPKQKMPMISSYNQYIYKYGLYRRNSGLQCNSKLREYHNELLKSKLNNNKNFKSVVGIYNQIYKEEVLNG